MSISKKKILVATAILLISCLGIVGCQTNTSVTEKSEQYFMPQDEKADEEISFPYQMDDGKLEIQSFFQYTGMNPDCGNEEGTDIASIMVKNVSDAFLENAEITMNTNDGREFNFLIEELPAGKVVMAFSKENAFVEANSIYSAITCETIFDSDASMQEDLISVSVEGTHITLQNNTRDELSNIVVYCHSTLEDQYFGGIAYAYMVNSIPANGTVKLNAVDCILGTAEVVRIEIN